MSILDQINYCLPPKPASVGDPDIYLGAKLRETQLPNGVWAWGLSPSKYVNQARLIPSLMRMTFPNMTGRDSDHAGCKSTRRSRTGILIFCNLALIQWISKRQPTIETSVFGTEFVTMKHGIKALRGLHYKLRMMGVPLTGPSFIYGDNKSQVTSSSVPESTLKKKSHSICYHAIHESVSMGESRITHFRTGENLSDPLTKCTFGAKRRRLLENILYDIYHDFL
jgi:hypothetical protein